MLCETRSFWFYEGPFIIMMVCMVLWFVGRDIGAFRVFAVGRFSLRSARGIFRHSIVRAISFSKRALYGIVLYWWALMFNILMLPALIKVGW